MCLIHILETLPIKLQSMPVINILTVHTREDIIIDIQTGKREV